MHPIDFDSWFEDVNATGTETGHCYGNHPHLLKFDLVFSGRVALMSLFLVAVGTYSRSFFNDFVVSQLFSEPTHALPV